MERKLRMLRKKKKKNEGWQVEERGKMGGVSLYLHKKNIVKREVTFNGFMDR